jgi:hypothetical protein
MSFRLHRINPLDSAKYRFFCPEKSVYISPVLNEKQVLVYYQYLLMQDFLKRLNSATMPINFEDILKNSDDRLSWEHEKESTLTTEQIDIIIKDAEIEAEMYAAYLKKFSQFLVDISKGVNIPTCLQMINVKS